MMEQRIVVGSDHAGLALKRELLASLAGWGWSPEDIGCGSAEGAVDYPTFAAVVAQRVAAGDPPLGLLICGTGIGMCIAANKVRGVRAALGADPYSAAAAREHNDANVLCLGGRVLGIEVARAILAAFLGGTFAGGRHQRRLELIEKLEAAGAVPGGQVQR